MRRSLPFTKMEAVGNDFVVVDDDDERPPGADDWPALAPALCDRRYGVGADGLLVCGASAVADLRMRMFNPDGTEDFCGNGIRCAVLWAQARGRVGKAGRVETIDGIRNVSTEDRAETIVTEMRPPRFTPAHLPMRVPGDGPVQNFPLQVDGGTVPVSVVSTGTTHTIVFADALPDEDTFRRLSPRIENHPLFPERTSVLWTTVESGARHLRLRIWERGAGETLGCGTGACAAAVAAIMEGRIAAAVDTESVEVASRGGTLRVAWAGGASPIYLAGPARVVYTGAWRLA